MKQGLNGQTRAQRQGDSTSNSNVYEKKQKQKTLFIRVIADFAKIQKISGVFSLPLKTRLQFVRCRASQFLHKILQNCGVVVFYGLWGYILLSSRQEISSTLGACLFLAIHA
jgi:hypothetical protein